LPRDSSAIACGTTAEGCRLATQVDQIVGTERRDHREAVVGLQARTRRHEYQARVTAKRWAELWPKVRFVD
jgi:hypothetical protein